MTVKEMIILTASYYRVALSEPVLAMYAEDLEGEDPRSVIEAYKAFRRDPKNKTMPLPAQILEMLHPTITPDAEARNLLGRIKTAIADFGYQQGTAAKEYIGEIGWQIVRESGGWARLCESNFLHNQAIQANARDRLTNLIQYGNEKPDHTQIGHSETMEKLDIRIKELFTKEMP